MLNTFSRHWPVIPHVITTVLTRDKMFVLDDDDIATFNDKATNNTVNLFVSFSSTLSSRISRGIGYIYRG